MRISSSRLITINIWIPLRNCIIGVCNSLLLRKLGNKLIKRVRRIRQTLLVMVVIRPVILKGLITGPERPYSLSDPVQTLILVRGETREDALEVMPVKNTRQREGDPTVVGRQCHRMAVERGQALETISDDAEVVPKVVNGVRVALDAKKCGHETQAGSAN